MRHNPLLTDKTLRCDDSLQPLGQSFIKGPLNKFLQPKEPQPTKMFTGQKKLQAGSAVQLMLIYCQNIICKKVL
jgi:hypothetical protein